MCVNLWRALKFILIDKIKQVVLNLSDIFSFIARIMIKKLISKFDLKCENRQSIKFETLSRS